MASPELRRLWALHNIDSELLKLRHRAAHLDVGFAEATKLKELEKRDSTEGETARSLLAEQVDLELKQKGFQDKRAKFEKQLFGGTVTNSREVEAIEKEIAMLRRQSGSLDDRILELMELAPEAQKTAEKLAQEIAETKKALSAKRHAAMAEKATIEAAYKAASEKREAARQAVPPALLNRYEAIVKRYEGIGMAEVVKKTACGACGTLLPTRTLQGALEGQVITCESCHRILYYTEGAI